MIAGTPSHSHLRYQHATFLDMLTDVVRNEPLVAVSWRWWTWIVAAYWQTHRPSWLASLEGWQPSGIQSAFIKWTGWTLLMAWPWWQHHKHCHLYYYY